MTLEQVQAAIEELDTAGKPSSANAVLAITGGSKRDVLPLLRQARAMVGTGAGDGLAEEAAEEEDGTGEEAAGNEAPVPPPAPSLVPSSPALDAARQAVTKARRWLIGQERKLQQCTAQVDAVQIEVDAIIQQVLIDEARARLGLYMAWDPRLGQAATRVGAITPRYERLLLDQQTLRRKVAEAQTALAATRTQRDALVRQAWVQSTYPALSARVTAAIADATARAQASGAEYRTLERILVDPLWEQPPFTDALRAVPGAVLDGELRAERAGVG